MFDWICPLTAVCLTCQNNKPKPKHRNEEPLEEWQHEIVPFRTIHIDHKGPLHPPSNRNLHCLLFIEAFSCFLMVYQLLILVLRLLNLLLRNGSIHSEFLTLLCMTEVGLSSLPNSSTGLKNWESVCDLKQYAHLGLVEKSKPKTNTSPVIGGNS